MGSNVETRPVDRELSRGVSDTRLMADERRERRLDQALENTFPASDPLALDTFR